MQTKPAMLYAKPIFSMADLGFEGKSGLDQASRALAECSEAQIVRWVQFPTGVLFFTLVPGDPESGGIFIFDRKLRVFYSIDFDDEKWGGYSLDDYKTLEAEYGLSSLAQHPWLLKRFAGSTGRA
jgi:hypothetical protein